MNDIEQIASNSLMVIVLFLFFYLIYLRASGKSFNESWDEIKNWMTKGKK